MSLRKEQCNKVCKILDDVLANRPTERDTLITAVRTVFEEQKWIPCSERLPEDCTEVFVYLFGRPSPYIAWIEDTHWYTEDFEVDREDEPVAWMPLPEPYREEGGKNE